MATVERRRSRISLNKIHVKERDDPTSPNTSTHLICTFSSLSSRCRLYPFFQVALASELLPSPRPPTFRRTRHSATTPPAMDKMYANVQPNPVISLAGSAAHETERRVLQAQEHFEPGR